MATATTQDVIIPINLEALHQHQQQLFSQLQPNMQVNEPLAVNSANDTTQDKNKTRALNAAATIQIAGGKLQLVHFIMGTPATDSSADATSSAATAAVRLSQEQRQKQLQALQNKLVPPSTKNLPVPDQVIKTEPDLIITPPTPVESPPKVPDQVFTCTICRSQHKDKASFNSHIKAHLKEKLTKRKRAEVVAPRPTSTPPAITSNPPSGSKNSKQIGAIVRNSLPLLTPVSVRPPTSTVQQPISTPKQIQTAHTVGSSRMVLMTATTPPTVAAIQPSISGKTQQLKISSHEKVFLLPLQAPMAPPPPPPIMPSSTILTTSCSDKTSPTTSHPVYPKKEVKEEVLSPAPEESELNRIDLHRDLSSLLEQMDHNSFDAPSSSSSSLPLVLPKEVVSSSPTDLLGFNQFLHSGSDGETTNQSITAIISKNPLSNQSGPTAKSNCPSPPPPHPCTQCAKTFTTRSLLKRHEKRSGHAPGGTIVSSSSVNPLVCRVCQKVCKNRVSLIRHRSKHLACTLCSTVFDNKIALQDHLLKSHPKAAVLSVEMPSHKQQQQQDEIPDLLRPATGKADTCLSSASLSVLLQGGGGSSCADDDLVDPDADMLLSGQSIMGDGPCSSLSLSAGSHYSDSGSASSVSPSPSASPAAATSTGATRTSKCSTIAEISDTSFFFDFSKSMEDEQDFIYSTDLFQA